MCFYTTASAVYAIMAVCPLSVGAGKAPMQAMGSLWSGTTIERLSDRERCRRSWVFATEYSSFLVVKLVRFTQETRKSHRHKTWALVDMWPPVRKRGDYTPVPPAPEIPADVLAQALAEAQAAVRIVIPGRLIYPPEQLPAAASRDE